jgi:hypothetical protein
MSGKKTRTWSDFLVVAPIELGFALIALDALLYLFGNSSAGRLWLAGLTLAGAAGVIGSFEKGVEFRLYEFVPLLLLTGFFCWLSFREIAWGAM